MITAIKEMLKSSPICWMPCVQKENTSEFNYEVLQINKLKLVENKFFLKAKHETKNKINKKPWLM